MELGDLAGWASVLIAAGAVFFAGSQIRLQRHQQAEARKFELRGVAVAWWPKHKPDRPNDDGSATWVYTIVADNPGRLPIRNVEVDVHFPCDVQRVLRNGDLQPPARSLNLGIAVLIGRSKRRWRRELVVPAGAGSMRAITATISFVDMAGVSHVNVWDSPPLDR